jgi:5-methyltetrahydropteroyltriglutamate--homocysteine methyltransferase
MKRSTDHLLTTHTGSLPRTPELVEALQRHDRGEAEEAGLADRVRAEVAATVARQAAAGISIVNDGEVGKIGYSTYVKERLDGFVDQDPEPRIMADVAEFPGYAKRISSLAFAMPACVDAVSYRSLDAVELDIAILESALASAQVADAFLSAASPGVIALFLPNRHYASHEEYVFALADAMKAEYDAIHAAGLVLQLDCPDLAMAQHLNQDSLEQFMQRARTNVEALNHATRDIPGDRLRMHVCWGNYEGPHNHDIALTEILDVVLAARPAGIAVEAANPRHEHEWKVFEDVTLPDDKVLIPGVINSTSNYIEHPEVVAQRLERYAGVVGRERVIGGSDCGFSTFASSEPKVHPEITWAKLAALAEGAALASSRLW